MRQHRRIGVYGVCRDEAGRILLVRGSAPPDALALWQIPGGGVEHGESPVDALAREFVEETGLTIRVVRLLDAWADLVAQPEQDRLVQHDRIVFEVAITGGDLRPEVDGTTDAVRWFASDQLGDLWMLRWMTRLVGSGRPVDEEPADRAAAVAAATVRDPDQLVTHVQRFAAYGLARDPAGRILLTRIAEGYPGAGTWHLPGGGTDFGESAPAALARELAEETGQEGDVGELLSVTHFHNPAAYGPEKRPIDWHTVRTIFRVNVAHPTEPIVHERSGSTDTAGWFSLVEAKGLNLNKLAREMIADYAT